MELTPQCPSADGDLKAPVPTTPLYGMCFPSCSPLGIGGKVGNLTSVPRTEGVAGKSLSSGRQCIEGGGAAWLF